MSEKLTPWFRYSIKPTRPGVYQTSHRESQPTFYSYFDGAKWHGGWWTAERAVTEPPRHKTPARNLRRGTYWRGLAEKP